MNERILQSSTRRNYYHRRHRAGTAIARKITSIVLAVAVSSATTRHSLVMALSTRAAAAAATTVTSPSRKSVIVNRVCISESVWRKAANDHAEKILSMIQPGLKSSSPSSSRRGHNATPSPALDPRHPVYNFLVEYYGLKGSKGVRRLTRWSPSPRLLVLQSLANSPNEDVPTINSNCNTEKIWTIDDIDDLTRLSSEKTVVSSSETHNTHDLATTQHEILLEGACEDDFGCGRLHLRGARIVQDGAIYCPTNFLSSSSSSPNDSDKQQSYITARKTAPFVWYQSILRNTAAADPILHCYNLHEWAMQYRPDGAPPPPSAKYQSHLPFRVSQQTINETVERKGVSCTHVDALRFFAVAAVKLNKYRSDDGQRLKRHDQPQLEQPGCLHAQMDLLKIYLKLQPYVDSNLLVDVLELALDARRLDVAASPYDASSYGVRAVPIETHDGRADYRHQQTLIWQRSESIRQELLQAYDDFLSLTVSPIGSEILGESKLYMPVKNNEQDGRDQYV